MALRLHFHLSNSNGDTFLADTKYKLLYDGFKIAPADLYQMTAYAIRYKAGIYHLVIGLIIYFHDWIEERLPINKTQTQQRQV